jgi:hypothetical protein
MGLIGVAVEQARGSGGAALLVEEKWQHLQHMAADGVRRVGGGNEAERGKDDQQCAHGKTIAGEKVNSI